jgi:hypothetical protein
MRSVDLGAVLLSDSRRHCEIRKPDSNKPWGQETRKKPIPKVSRRKLSDRMWAVTLRQVQSIKP